MESRLPARRAAGVLTAAMAAVALLLGLVAAPATADPHPWSAEESGDVFAYLQLSISGSSMHPGGSVTLTCSPSGDGGTHPTPEDACDSLRAVDGNFDQLPAEPGIACIDIYDPVWAEAEGLWVQGGKASFVDYSEEFGNWCYAVVSTDLVFQF